ncbi:MAG TPA: NAD-dependent epimerase/dehydratase family protein [Candidatus Dormibacteraeota bacterium]|nr:NAD-dependent epimerase/dehydratase family protein [Candidatus Dormibacteraeota bacterium]
MFVAGASGVIGQSLVPLLVKDGHVVAGMTRSPDKSGMLKKLGAQSVICDVYDFDSLKIAIVEFAPDVVVHQLTDLPDDATRIPEFAEAQARIRREGTRNLLLAAKAVGVSRFLAQSVAWDLKGEGAASKAELEHAVLNAKGVVIRYGQFYGLGTYFEDQKPSHPRIHVAEAARRTLPLLYAPSGIVTLIEDE